MITQEHEFYIRYILLLLQGGTDLLRRIAETALHRNNSDLANLLTSAESTIKRDKHLSRLQKETLYPCSPQEARIEDFDITLLSYLITNHLKSYIYSNELDAVNAIREMRNDHAHVSEAKMTFPVYNTKWTELVGIINTGISGLSLEEQKAIKTTTMSIAGDPIDIKTVVEELKRLDDSKVFFETIQNSLCNIQKSQEQLVDAVTNVGKAQQQMSGDVSNVKEDVEATRAELRQIKEQMKQMAENQKTMQEMIIFLGKLQLSTVTGKSVENAEDFLLVAAKHSIEKSTPDESHQSVTESVNKLVDDIEEKGVKVQSIDKGSVILEFTCSSLTAAMDLIDYFDSSDFQSRLNEIANALEEACNQKIYIKGFIDNHSLQESLTKLKKKMHTKVVNIEMSCNGVDGLLHALDVFEDGKAVDSLNGLAKALSDAVGTQVTLKSSIDIEQMKKAMDSLRKQLAYIAETSHQQKKGTASLTQGNPVYVKSTTDKQTCWISGCAIISPDRILLADRRNLKLKVVDMRKQTVAVELKLDAAPYDITLLPDDQAAVTVPEKQEIMIFKTDKHLSVVRTLNVYRDCWGITYNEYHLYVVCWYPHSVLDIDIEGNIHRDIPLKNSPNFKFVNPLYIAFGRKKQNLYISAADFIASLTLQGEVTAVYRHDDLKRPVGMLMLEDGSMLVCCYMDPGTIHYIFADLTQGTKLAENVLRAQSICCQPDQQHVYVGTNSTNLDDDVKVFKFNKGTNG